METTPEVLNAIETAIQIEKDGLAFYTESAAKTDDPKHKRIFQWLAKDEAAHLQLFEDARSALLAGGIWPSLDELGGSGPGLASRPHLFPSDGEVTPTGLSEHRLAVLEKGIRAEEGAISFYREQMTTVDDANAKEVYAFLIEQEELHRSILQAEYDYFSSLGF